LGYRHEPLVSGHIFSFLRNFHIAFYNGCTNLHSHLQCIRVLIFPHPHQHFLLFVFLILAILTGMRWNLIMDPQNQYCENGQTTENNLYLQCNPHQNSNNILHIERKKSIVKFIWKHKDLKCNPEQKGQCWIYHSTQFRTILQSHSNKNSMILAQKQTKRTMEHNRRSSNKSTQLQPFDFWQRSRKYMLKKKQPLQQIQLKTVYPPVGDWN
jgi:hypothetical protein